MLYTCFELIPCIFIAFLLGIICIENSIKFFTYLVPGFLLFHSVLWYLYMYNNLIIGKCPSGFFLVTVVFVDFLVSGIFGIITMWVGDCFFEILTSPIYVLLWQRKTIFDFILPCGKGKCLSSEELKKIKSDKTIAWFFERGDAKGSDIQHFRYVIFDVFLEKNKYNYVGQCLKRKFEFIKNLSGSFFFMVVLFSSVISGTAGLVAFCISSLLFLVFLWWAYLIKFCFVRFILTTANN